MREVKWALGEALPHALLDLVFGALNTSKASTPLILVDGLSGAGKSSFAAALATTLAHAPTQDHLGLWRIIGPDLWFPGWHGLRAAQPVTTQLITDLRCGRIGFYRPWDWKHNHLLEAVEVSPGIPTIIEGCGALTPDTRPLCDLALWVETAGGDTLRRLRALRRDGDTYRPWWQCWQKQDYARLKSDRPQELADALVLT